MSPIKPSILLDVDHAASVPVRKRNWGTQNFHWALRYREGNVVEEHTYNGYVLSARNALALRIPALPDRWKGRDRETTRCKNFQFAVEYFGYPSR